MYNNDWVAELLTQDFEEFAFLLLISPVWFITFDQLMLYLNDLIENYPMVSLN